ncbi:MAG TPA: signal peptide peptidase SppA [Candidatus Goldiibacteriota bacterium]|nr:signal peptide peptidase SppA [Candidatus Goldiibacteriota bacterium]
MRKRVIAIIAVAFILIVLLVSSVVKKGGSVEKESLLEAANKKVGLINVYGDIVYSEYFLEQINTFSNMKNVKAVVFRLNSPGGGVAASQEIYREIKRLKSKGKAVVVSMGDTAASGAYYIAAAADRIYANPGTITGSIGVIVNFMNGEKLLDKVGLDFVTIKSGRYKDTGSFSRKATEDEKALVKGLIDDVLIQFVDDVVDCRVDKLAEAFGIKEKDETRKKRLVKDYMIKNIADGRIFTGKEALKLGLVDELGNIDDAITGAAAMVGISGRPLVISVKKKKGLSAWLDSKLGGLNFRQETGFSVKYILK